MSTLSVTTDVYLDFWGTMESFRRTLDTDTCFPKFVEYLNELDPSDMPDRLRVTLRNLGFENEWDEYLASQGILIPNTVSHGGSVRWVIAPII